MELTDDGLALLWLSARDFDIERVRTKPYHDEWISVDLYWDVTAEERRREIDRLLDEVAEDENAVLRYGGWLHLHRPGVREEAATLQADA